MKISLRLNSSHLDKLMKIPSGGPRSSIMESAPQNSLSGASQHPIIQVPCLKDETKAAIICIDGVNNLVQNQSEKTKGLMDLPAAHLPQK